jgi:hypothetical protein
VPPFTAPDPVPVTISSDLPREAVLARLRAAILEPAYSEPSGSPPRLYRLGGTATDEALVLTATPCLRPGLRAGSGSLTLELHGAIQPVGGRSEIRGTVVAPVAKRTVRTLAIVVVGFLVLSLAGSGPDPFLIVFGLVVCALVSVAWVAIIRHNQRTALDNVETFTRFVRSVLSEEPARPSPSV